jgi:hypothetical protein
VTPGDEADDVEDGKDEEYNGRRVVMEVEVYDGRPEPKNTVENTGNPNELLRSESVKRERLLSETSQPVQSSQSSRQSPSPR